MRIRNAGLQDVAEISRVYCQSWKKAYQGIVPEQYLMDLAQDTWVELFTERLNSRSLSLMVVTQENQIIGAAAYGPSREKQQEGWAEVISLYLLPAYWRKGLGKALLSCVLEQLCREGYHAVFLWVQEQNLPARKFYEAFGFTCTEDSCMVEIGGKSLRQIQYIWKKAKIL